MKNVDAGVKINDVYYYWVLMTQKLLPVMREVFSSPLSSNKAMPLLLLTDRERQQSFWNDTHLCSFHQTFGQPTARI